MVKIKTANVFFIFKNNSFLWANHICGVFMMKRALQKNTTFAEIICRECDALM